MRAVTESFRRWTRFAYVPSFKAAGSLRCEIQDAEGTPIPGFTLADSDELYGDSLERSLSWNGSCELKSLAVESPLFHCYDTVWLPPANFTSHKVRQQQPHFLREDQMESTESIDCSELKRDLLPCGFAISGSSRKTQIDRDSPTSFRSP